MISSVSQWHARLLRNLVFLVAAALLVGPLVTPHALAAGAVPELGKTVKKTTEKGVTVWRVMPVRAPTMTPRASDKSTAVPTL
ncbi:MAG: hypothetical protein AAFR69_06725, partial [Pseudomonadota bacterium]